MMGLGGGSGPLGPSGLGPPPGLGLPPGVPHPGAIPGFPPGLGGVPPHPGAMPGQPGSIPHFHQAAAAAAAQAAAAAAKHGLIQVNHPQQLPPQNHSQLPNHSSHHNQRVSNAVCCIYFSVVCFH